MNRNWLENRLQQIDKRKTEMAHALGIPTPRVSEILVGKRRLRASEIKPLAAFLDVGVTELLDSIES